MRSRLHSPRTGFGRLRIALVLSLAAAALLAAGCGGSDDSQELTGEPFTAQNEADWNGALTKIGDLVTADDCAGAQQKLDTLRDAVEGVPADVDESLKDDLIDLLGQLDEQISTECEPADTTTTESDTTDESTTTTTETTTEDTTTEDTTKTETTETTPTEPDQPETPTPPSGQGGTPGGGTTGGGGTGGGGGGGTGGTGGIAPREAR
ncbi:MAG: hypothetical protein U0R24_15230 [Solirubrobacterales bacterium]